MSKIIEEVLDYVKDPSVGGTYGAWGALRPQQRDKIRELALYAKSLETMVDDSYRELLMSKEEKELIIAALKDYYQTTNGVSQYEVDHLLIEQEDLEFYKQKAQKISDLIDKLGGDNI